MILPELVIDTIETTAGRFGAVLSDRGLCRLTLPTEPVSLCEAWADRWVPGARRISDARQLADLAAQLRAYLAGERRAFDLPLDPRGTPFQLAVWQALQGIPYGETRSYADLAAALGRPRAVRAVGRANATNPVPILVPCHRVIGKGGGLTGYAGGLEVKQRLLALEGR